jgi:hypothetical protein
MKIKKGLSMWITGAVWILVFAFNISQVGAGQEKRIDLVWGVKIPLRDGVKLNATIYKPKEMKEPLPVIFTLTPYIGFLSQSREVLFGEWICICAG